MEGKLTIGDICRLGLSRNSQVLMGNMMATYHDSKTCASNSITVSLSASKLKILQPELYNATSQPANFRWGARILGPPQIIQLIAEHLSFGDSRAAVVVQESPLVVAAYTDELDCVALLSFPDWLRQDYQLRSVSRLLTINTYGRGKGVSPDLVPGPASLGRWTAFYPIIAEFVSDDLGLIDRRKQSIGSEEWERTWTLGQAKLSEPTPKIRDGRPLWSRNPPGVA
jgi:hypothetical protein